MVPEHVTKPSALEGIILRGIVPGGNDRVRRLTSELSHLGTARTSRPRLRCATSKREMTSSPSTSQSGVASGGTIVAFETIPLQRHQGDLPVCEERTGQRGQTDLLPHRQEQDLSRIQGRCVGVTPADCLGNLTSVLNRS